MSTEVVRPQIARLRKALLRWYDSNQRDLPWRRTRDPYCIWVSEIMLQQTRVAAVLEHYRRWFELFPDMKALASARLEDVLAAWSGLGYYRRARMLHQAAKVIAEEMNGTIPRTSKELRDLPGVGRYTAAAIASIAFAEPVAVVDGNVERVFARFYGRELSPSENWDTAQQWLSADRPGDWNQAMMELGATICTPANPRCKLCPLKNRCAGSKLARIGTKAISSRSPLRNRKTVARALLQRGDRVYLVQRAVDAKKMAAMWELPEVVLVGGEEPLLKVRHSITDTDYVVHVYAREVKDVNGGRWCRPADLERMAITGLTRKVLRKVGILPS